MDNQYLQEVSDEKDLGIMIMNDLKSAAQVVEACKKANRALGMISHTIKYKSKSGLLSLYKTLVRPHLEYCTPVWSPKISTCYRKYSIDLLFHQAHPVSGGGKPCPFPSSPLSFPFLPLPSPSLPQIQLGCVGERCKLPQQVRGRALVANAFLVYFEAWKHVWRSQFCSVLCR